MDKELSPSQQGPHVLLAQPRGAPVVDEEHPKTKTGEEPHHRLVLCCYHRVGSTVGPYCKERIFQSCARWRGGPSLTYKRGGVLLPRLRSNVVSGIWEVEWRAWRWRDEKRRPGEIRHWLRCHDRLELHGRPLVGSGQHKVGWGGWVALRADHQAFAAIKDGHTTSGWMRGHGGCGGGYVHQGWHRSLTLAKGKDKLFTFETYLVER